MKRKRLYITLSRGKRHLGTGIFLLMILAGQFAGCEPEDWIIDVDCNECFGSQPDSAALIIRLTINKENPAVPLTFYRGSTDGEIDWLDTATTAEWYVDAEVWTEYTVKAEYRSGSTYVIAFDSDQMTLSDFGTDCGDPCYIIKGGIFDVELREPR
jgi:hypothetical protein